MEVVAVYCSVGFSAMSTRKFSLDQLGWSAIHSQSLTPDDLSAGYPARVGSAHRSGLTVLSERGIASVIVPPHLLHGDDPSDITVGDWLLIEHDAPRVLRVLERRSLIARMAAGMEQKLQPIAANLDTLFVVTSCNQDFNPSRLERYLAIARNAGVTPVILLTKIDLVDASGSFVVQAQSVAGDTLALALNATDAGIATQLSGWLSRGQTVAFVGSSGVGKSTIVNSLIGADAQLTAGIREDDSKGRHTTTSRQMLELPSGAWVIDTPGMRELKLGAVEAGVAAVFSDIEELARECRFRDCGHRHDDGCALQAAVVAGRLDSRRLGNYLKLQREAAHATRPVHERREIDRRFGRARHIAERERLKRRRR